MTIDANKNEMTSFHMITTIRKNPITKHNNRNQMKRKMRIP